VYGSAEENRKKEEKGKGGREEGGKRKGVGKGEGRAGDEAKRKKGGEGRKGDWVKKREEREREKREGGRGHPKWVRGEGTSEKVTGDSKLGTSGQNPGT
jgi:hypothetical protein